MTGGVATELIDARSVLEKLVAVDFGVLEPADVRASVPVMNETLNLVAAADAKLVAAVDNPYVYVPVGCRNATAYLRKNSNQHGAAAAGRVRRAMRLPKMRLVGEAFDRGQITVDHVPLLGELTEKRWYAAFVEAEGYLLEAALGLGWGEFQRLVNIWKAAADPTEPSEKHQSDLDAREFHLSKSWNDRGIASGTFTPEGRLVVQNELDRISLQLLHHDRSEAQQRLGRTRVSLGELDRTPGQRRHDAMVILAQRSAAADAHLRPLEPQIYVRATDKTAIAALMKIAGLEFDPIPVEDFECEFDDGAPMCFEELAKFLVTGKIHAVLQDQDGAILHFGRGARWFSKDQKAAVAYRDRVCGCGCNVLARVCDLDHVIEWADLGLTDITNAEPQCRGSHTNKTETNKHRRQPRRRRDAGYEPGPDG